MLYYQLQIFLISALLIIGFYEILQLTQLGKILVNAVRFTKKRYYDYVLAKKTWKNTYKYLQTL